MNVKIEDVSSIKKKLTFEIDAETVGAEIEKAYSKIAKTAKIKGFRAGKVPRAVLEKYYGPQMEEQVLGKLINDSYFKALVDNKVAAVSDPEIAESGALKKGEVFTYEALVEVKPEVEVKDYEGLLLQKEKFEADEKHVESRLEEMASSKATLEVTSRKKARAGDSVVIDFEGFIDGVPFDGGKGEDHVLELGSGSFIPGFEDQVAGMKREDEKDVEVSFPEEYGNKDLAGKPAVFKVVLKEIKEKVLPKFNDEFAKDFGVDSIAELRQKIEESYMQQETGRVEGDLRERLVNALIERNPIEVPEAMIGSQLEYMLGNIRSRMQSQGMSLEMLGMDEDSFKQMYRETAVGQVRGSLILEAVARQEDLALEDGEIDGKLEEIAKMSNAPLDAVKKYYAGAEARQGLMSQLVEEKAVSLLLEKSTIEEVDKEELAAQAGEDEKE